MQILFPETINPSKLLSGNASDRWQRRTISAFGETFFIAWDLLSRQHPLDIR